MNLTEEKKILSDLENIYKIALKSENLTAAIQAKKAIATIYHMFKNKSDVKSISDLSHDQIKMLIEEYTNK